MYGITNLLTRRATTRDGTPTGPARERTNLFPESPTEAPAQWRLASPVTHVRKDVPPTLILHGTADTTVDRDQSRELHRALQAAGAGSTLRMVPGANHAWPLKTGKFDLTGEVVAFCDRHLKPR
jgi:dipeptidyl aminopeptidase/acylaminoacyl peptidase